MRLTAPLRGASAALLLALASPDTAAADALATDLRDAMDAPGTFSATVVAGPGAPTMGDQRVAVLPSFGKISPAVGPDLAVLCSGAITPGPVTPDPEPGTDVPGNEATLTLSFTAPEGLCDDEVTACTQDAQCGAAPAYCALPLDRLAFSYTVVSAEYPEAPSTRTGDVFSAVLDDTTLDVQTTLASVGPADLVAMASTRLAGSAFDLFSVDAMAAPSSYGDGYYKQPDAGGTSGEVGSDVLVPGHAYTLTFDVADGGGDPLYDTCVLLDGFQLTSFEVVDPNYPDQELLNLDGSVKTSAQDVKSGGRAVKGAAADGSTRVVLREEVALPGGEVEFCIASGNSTDGSIVALDETDDGNPICELVGVTTLGLFPNWEHWAFALYEAPETFPGTTSERSVEVGLTATWYPATSTASLFRLDTSQSFEVVRPPVVLVHGVWSSSKTWTFRMNQDPRRSRYSVHLADYKSTNASHFSTNDGVVPGAVQEALAPLREDDGIAATKVDVGAHSMGGVLTRRFIGSGSGASYARQDNFGEGDIRSLVTMDTPNTGSPLASRLSTRQDGFFGGILKALFRTFKRPIDKGAIDDLSDCSAALGSIPATPVPSHALVGDPLGSQGSSAALLAALASSPVLAGAYLILDFFTDISSVLTNDSDAIVLTDSQIGGISDFTSDPDFADGIHTNNAGSDDYSDRLEARINDPLNSANLSNFPSVASQCSSAAPAAPPAAASAAGGAAAAGSSCIEITSPLDGSSVLPGAVFCVELNTSCSITDIIVVGPGRASSDPGTLCMGTGAEIDVPLDFLGDFELLAAGKTSTESDYYESLPVTLSVGLPGSTTLLDTTLLGGDVFLPGASPPVDLDFIGSFSDGGGVDREITEHQNTEFFSSDTGVVSVDANGVLTPQGPGTAVVVATAKDPSMLPTEWWIGDSITVTVLPEPGSVASTIAGVAMLCALARGRRARAIRSPRPHGRG